MKTGPGNVKPIVLENIILYGMDGKPVRTYKRLELDGEAVRGDDGKYLLELQDGCNKYFTARGDGRRLPVLPELYAIIERLHETKQLRRIATDLRKSWLITGTKIDYSKNIIIHPGYGISKCLTPVGNRWLDEAIKGECWENTLQALLMCKDIKKAVNVLHEAGGKEPYIWTPSTEFRMSMNMSEKAVGLGASANSDRFLLYCGCPVYYFGRFRGVWVEGAAGAPRGKISA